jgi:DNA-binding CsgD family transcriptional regulator
MTLVPSAPQTSGARPPLDAYSDDIVVALEDVNVPSYLIDPAGVIRWVNPCGVRLVGDVRGKQFTSVVSSVDVHRARENFTRMMLQTTKVADNRVHLQGPDGAVIEADASSVALVDGHRVIGIFGQLPHVVPQESHKHHPKLTPRQSEVLHLLSHGHSTEQIATELHLSVETVRNHVRHLMRSLGVNSRLQAVALARREALI